MDQLFARIVRTNTMQIVKGFPPNIAQLYKKFKITPETVFTYGDKLYNPMGNPIPQDLMVHEETHEQQQKVCGVEQWWTLYLDNPNFRLTQEVEAYRNQYQFLKTVLNRKARLGTLNILSEHLASPLYGNIVNKKEAKELIDV
jgi:hypothetical protein